MKEVKVQIKVLTEFVLNVVGAYLVEKIQEKNEILYNFESMAEEIKESIMSSDKIDDLSFLCTKDFLMNFLDKCTVSFIKIWMAEYLETLKSIAENKNEDVDAYVRDMRIVTDRVLRTQFTMDFE